MGQREESVVRAFVSGWHEAFDDETIARMLDSMSDDIRYQVYAWERPIVGRDAVHEELLQQAKMGFGGVRSEISTIGSVDQTVFIERTDSMMIGRKPLTIHIAAVFEVNAEGKISAWREYYDTREISMKLGRDAGTAGSRPYDA
jgi:limonene-1,2-epoxide hydrolase